jgi:hypothetical protein
LRRVKPRPVLHDRITVRTIGILHGFAHITSIPNSKRREASVPAPSIRSTRPFSCFGTLTRNLTLHFRWGPYHERRPTATEQVHGAAAPAAALRHSRSWTTGHRIPRSYRRNRPPPRHVSWPAGRTGGTRQPRALDHAVSARRHYDVGAHQTEGA